MSLQTANKLGTTQRLGTGAKQINQKALEGSIGFTTTTNANSLNRIVTQQGLEGIKNRKESSGGRRIIDKYYYVNLFKKKINDISKEIVKVKTEIEGINKDTNEYNTLNKTFENLSKEVQNLEGELADYNLAGDKYRSSMRAEDIEAVFHHIQLSNKKKRDQSDYLYIEKAKYDEELARTEYEINQIMQTMEQRLMDLEPEQKIEYEQLREDNQQYIMKIFEIREELSRVNTDLQDGENLLKNNNNKKEAHKLKDQINQMMRKKEELELQTNESGLSVEELKLRLVNKIKEDTQDKQNFDKRVIDLRKVIDSYKKSLSEIEKEMKSNTTNENVKAHDSISQKDKEYSNFITNFEEIRKNHIKEIQMKEEIVVSLLESASTRVSGTGSNSRDIKADIEDKKAKIKDSLSTLEEAKQQYENLQTKMKRLDNLEETLGNEIKNFKEKIDKSRQEIADKFDRIEYQKDFFKAEEKKMQENMKFLVKNRDNYEKLLTGIILKSRSKTSQMEELDTYKKMREMEKKMQENENYIYSLLSFIDAKQNENSYAQIAKECIDLQQEINNELVRLTSGK